MKPLHILTALALILAGFGASAVINVTVNPETVIIDSWKPTFSAPSCSNGTEGVAGSCSLSVSENDPSGTAATCTHTAGTLPTGHSVSSDCSQVSYTSAAAAGAISYTVSACVGVNCTSQVISFTIAAAASARIGTGCGCDIPTTYDYCQGTSLTLARDWVDDAGTNTSTITYTFSETVNCGEFFTGEPLITPTTPGGTVTITAATPAATGTGGS